MISIKFSNLKNITSHLLVKDTFNNWLLTEGQIYTHSLFTISGKVNPDYANNTDENEHSTNLSNEYNSWQLLRPICYEIIKGKQLPTSFKFVLKLSTDKIKEVIDNSDFKSTDIDGLFINIKYEKGILSLTTGTSIKIFTLDKSVDKAFDSYVLKFIDSNQIEYTIL